MPFFSKDQNPVQRASHWCMMLMSDKMTDSDYAAFMAWCDERPENRTLLDEAIQAWQALDPISSSPGMIEMRSAALNDLKRAQWAQHGFQSRPVQWAAACAALIVVGISAIGGTWLMTKPDQYRTGDAERRIVVLEDGSRLSLDADTVVRVKYDHHQRRLWLTEGRAKFDVAKNPQRPFTVTAEAKSVLATGTQFSVERLSGEVHVILYQGHVNVFQDAGGSQARRPLRITNQPGDTTLHAGEELVSQTGSDQATIAPVKPAQSLDWETGQLVFDNTPLALAVQRVNRYTQNKIALDDTIRKPILVSGIYTAGDVDAFIDGVTALSSLTYTSHNGRYVLEPKRN